MWYASICFYLCPWFEWSRSVRLSSPSAHSQFTPFHVHYSKTAQLEICFKSMSNDTFFARNCYIPKWSNIETDATCHSRTKIEFTRTDSQDNFITITFGAFSTKNFTNFLGLGPCSGTGYYVFKNFDQNLLEHHNYSLISVCFHFQICLFYVIHTRDTISTFLAQCASILRHSIGKNLTEGYLITLRDFY